MVRIRVVCVVLAVLAGWAVAQRWITPAETTNFRFTRFDGEYGPGTSRVYFLGGRLPAGTTDGTVWGYDPAARTYAATGAVMPIPVSNYDICLVRDNYTTTDTFGLYVVGGRTATGANTDTVQIYYPRSNTTRRLTTDAFPGRLGGAVYAALGCVVAANKIYVMGGFLPTTYAISNLCYVFDPLAPAGSRWSQLPNLGLARSYIAGAVIEDTLLYAIGGDTAISPALYARQWVERLNLRNLGAGWVRVRDMPIPCGESRAYAFNTNSGLGISRQIVVAGTGQWPAESARCHLYHVTGDSWNAFPPLDSARRNHAGAFIPGTAGTNGVPGIWVWGGRKASDANCLKTPEYYAMGLNVGVTRIMAPTGGVDSGSTVTPACSVYNYGAASATYRVRMRIGTTYTDSATVTNHPGGTRLYVTFPNWTANVPRGNHAVACSTRCPNDFQQSNDKQTGAVTVLVHDVGARAIVSPSGTVDSTATIVPACSVYNYGNAAEAGYPVRMKIGTSYNQTATVPSHPAGTSVYVTFTPWTVGSRGTYAVTCSTELSTDQARPNDKMSGQVTIRIQDVGATEIIAPAGTIPLNEVVSPQVKVKNFGNTAATFDVRLRIDNATTVYDTAETVTALGPGAELVRTFTKTWPATPAGVYTATANTVLSGDVYPSNDMVSDTFTVRAGGTTGGWTAKRPMPTQPSGKNVKDGGWLAFDDDMGLVYAAKGNKVGDFYSWDPVADSWTQLNLIPSGRENKLPAKGAKGCSDDNGQLFMTKGNNTLGFWKYACAVDSWYQKADVPIGPGNKKVKGGTDIIGASSTDADYVYLLKGYKNEFYKYFPVPDTWHRLPDAPAGQNPRWDKGSWLAYDLDHTIYAHKAKYHEFYSFDTQKDSWNPGSLTPMPTQGSGGTKKSKDGGCGTYHDAAIYALKGGNTQEFWKYIIAEDRWVELESIPKGMPKPKKVKAGADITTRPLMGDRPGEPADLPALKGNNTDQLWVYYVTGTPSDQLPGRDGVMAAGSGIGDCRLTIAPNPLAGGFLTLSFSGALGHARNGLLCVSVFDVAGRCVLSRSSSVGHQASSVGLDIRSLSAGVYLLKVRSAEFTAVRKLVIDR